MCSYAKMLRSLALVLLCVALCSCASDMKRQTLADLSASTGDGFMGDWVGTYTDADGYVTEFVAQAIALGDNKYRMNILHAFDTGLEPTTVLDATLDGAKVTFTGAAGHDVQGEGVFEGTTLKGTYSGDGAGSFEMNRVVRLSPTLGQKPPKGAIVLLDGKSTEEWQHPGKDGPITWPVIDGAMQVDNGSIVTKRKFRDYKLHIEFRTPYMPKERGQGRGNSGVYLAGRYEIQVLDSYGLEGLDNECGGIYRVARPRVNMCAPPGQWQTYDIAFRAPRSDNNEKKTDNARLTLIHNGVKIHDQIEIPGPTGGALDQNELLPGGIYLQDHGNPVQYRNIWLVEVE
jgi:hypothetical protein